jgi:hypothetical protein
MISRAYDRSWTNGVSILASLSRRPFAQLPCEELQPCKIRKVNQVVNRELASYMDFAQLAASNDRHLVYNNGIKCHTRENSRQEQKTTRKG